MIEHRLHARHYVRCYESTEKIIHSPCLSPALSRHVGGGYVGEEQFTLMDGSLRRTTVLSAKTETETAD